MTRRVGTCLNNRATPPLGKALCHNARCYGLGGRTTYTCASVDRVLESCEGVYVGRNRQSETMTTDPTHHPHELPPPPSLQGRQHRQQRAGSATARLSVAISGRQDEEVEEVEEVGGLGRQQWRRRRRCSSEGSASPSLPAGQRSPETLQRAFYSARSSAARHQHRQPSACWAGRPTAKIGEPVEDRRALYIFGKKAFLQNTAAFLSCE